MPTSNRSKNQKRRQRRNVSLLTRAYRTEALNRLKVQSILLAILQDAGGTRTFSKETMDVVVKNLGTLAYSVTQSEDKLSFTVELVTRTEVAPEPEPADDAAQESELIDAAQE